MTMCDGKSNEELASAFITSTCQLIPRSSHVYIDHMHNLTASKNPVTTEYSILCGSLAEFYIRPLITCIDDADYLITNSDQLVFSGEFSVLPSDLSGLPEAIECLMIEPYYDSYPGFVRLRILGDMNYNWKLKKYVFNITANTNSHFSLNLDAIAEKYSPKTLERGCTIPSIVSGPAVKHQNEFQSENFATIDFVACLWCHQWPKEAQGWLSRPRCHGWPTTDIISKVVQSGCHLVNFKHRSCRNDKLQWRFSFSFAELILLQSWTKTQQIVYHLLRFFAKRELMQKDCPKDDEVLCTYHLKTLMLWASEEKSPEWWSNPSVIAICSELLKMLAEWLKRNFCPNHFIPEANLFHKHPISTIDEKIEKRLTEFCNSGVLCNWFVENYILYFIRRHLELTGTRKTMPHFCCYMPPLFETWRMFELNSLDYYFSTTLVFSCKGSRNVIKFGLNSLLGEDIKAVYKFRSDQLKINWRLRYPPTIQVVGLAYCGILVHILHTVYGLDYEEISWDSNLFLAFVKAISMQSKIVRSQYHNFSNTYTTQSSHFQFQRAQCLMENITGSNSRSEFHLLSLIAKQLLRKALKHHDSTSNGIAHAALAYLAAIHYATSEYQEATRLCSAILMDQTSKEDREILNAGCLLFIDDVARIVGLCVLQIKITEDNLHNTNRRLHLDLRLSPEVFAQNLLALSIERISTLSRRSDFNHDLSGSSFYMDVYTKGLMKMKCSFSMISDSHCNAAKQIVYRRPDSEASSVNPTIDKEKILDALMEYALENMASFYNGIRKDYGFDCNTSDCYRALYLYKSRQYDQVLHLCELILRESDLQNNLKEFSFANVLLLPPLDCFFDRDVQSLLGFHTLFYGLSPLNDPLEKVKCSDKSTFNHWFSRYACTYTPGLMHSLFCPYSIKCHYFLGRHFVAKYLNLRCCIDCNLPYSEALTEFAAHKTNFPFEHIICRFLLRK